MKHFISFWLVLTVLQMGNLISNISGRSITVEHQNELRKKLLMDELNEMNNELDKQLLDLSAGKRFKRSDIDARLLEIQAKILLTKAYQKMPAGHGRFDFNKIGKRSIDENFNELKRPLVNNKKFNAAF